MVEARRHPRNAAIGILFAASFLVSAVLGWIALADAFGTLGELSSRRSLGFVVLGPLVFTVLGGVALVRAVQAWAPWRRYLAATSPDQRRADRAHDNAGQRRWPFIVFGGLALAGQVAIAIAARPETWASLASGLIFAEMHLLLATIWLACAGNLVQAGRAAPNR